MKQKTKKPLRYRNPVACSPIMRKGGVHEKSNSAKRGAAKRELKKKAMNWQGDSSLSSFQPWLKVFQQIIKGR